MLFKVYTDTRPHPIMVVYPGDDTIEALVDAEYDALDDAGFDPYDENLIIDTLTQGWFGHPPGAIVVSGQTDAGYATAVSVSAHTQITGRW